jgi:hypothetical protein
MPETSIVIRVYKWKPFTGRQAGRPKSRWEGGVRNDLKKMKLMKWGEQVQNRLKWKNIVEKTKTLPVVAPGRRRKKKKKKKTKKKKEEEENEGGARPPGEPRPARNLWTSNCVNNK